MNAAERWDRTVLLSKDRWGDSYPTLGDNVEGKIDAQLVRFRRNTRLFLKGDIALLGFFWNGQAERHPITGRSSRGYDVRHFYVRHARWAYTPRWNSDWDRDGRIPSWQLRDRGGSSKHFANRVSVEFIELPGELHGKSVADPDVRRYVVERLCAADSASP